VGNGRGVAAVESVKPAVAQRAQSGPVGGVIKRAWRGGAEALEVVVEDGGCAERRRGAMK